MSSTLEAFCAISAIGITYSMISIMITRRFGNRSRIKGIQKQINETTKEYNEAMKRGDEAEMKRLGPEQAKMPGLLKESLILQFKPLIFLLPFLFVLPNVARTLFPEFVIQLSFDVPVFIQHFERFPNWRNEFGAVGWFWLSFLFSSLSCQLLVGLKKKLSKRMGKGAEASEETAGMGKGAEASEEKAWTEKSDEKA
ncbi:MAG: DUF106 domain-containing protein [Candidatus Aenigmarchaeota archaeon]|nr:DUF106 domain-containing protein [Candidatus Aenigmarchaeota archaeon]